MLSPRNLRADVVNVFESLRELVPVREAVERCTEFDERSSKARCISGGHPDYRPSMHLYEDHVHCFSCSFHADVTGLWAAARGIESQAEAARDLAREFGVELPERDPEAQREAQARREKEESHLEQARAHHRNLGERPKVREWWVGRGFGEDLQKRFLLGASEDGNEAIIPYWSRGRVKGVIRRKLKGKPKYVYPKAEHFPERYKPLFIPGPSRPGTFLVEGIVDALAVTTLGESGIAVGGTNISKHQMQQLRRLPGPLYVLPDADQDGAEAARRWVRDLYPKAFVCPAEYGEGLRVGKNKDFADLFAAKGDGARETLEHLKNRAVDGLEIAVEGISDEPSKRRRLKRVRERVFPLVFGQLEANGPAALPAPAKHPEVLAALDDVAEATKLKFSLLKSALEEEAERRALKVMAAVKRETGPREDLVPEEAYAPLLEPGVLDRYVEAAARMHGVVGDRQVMKLITLVAVGAQLDLLPNGKPAGPSAMLTAEPGRGKNYLTDAVVGLLPPEWWLAFEAASAASLYYQVMNDPDFLRHRFIYPNEAEATDALVEFLRPMLSAGKAVRLTVNNLGPNGANEGQVLEVRGPVTAVIPTVRNKLDEQLQSRLLVTELEDYEGRIKEHSLAASKLLRPDYVSVDHTETVRAWQAALRSLTEVRRVVFQLDHQSFALDNDGIPHGARLWTNLLGLMCAHAWLEQRNRDVIELPSGKRAVAATPDDYETAYELFQATCRRTGVNLSDTHRKILDTVYALQEKDPDSDGFPQRKIAEEGEVSTGAVSKHKAFLVTSAKLLREGDNGLTLVKGAEPSWWSDDDLMSGLPRPEQVKSWWRESFLPDGGRVRRCDPRELDHPSQPHETRECREHTEEENQSVRADAENVARVRDKHLSNTREHDESDHQAEHALLGGSVNGVNVSGSGRLGNGKAAFTGFTGFTGAGASAGQAGTIASGEKVLDDEEGEEL